MRLTDTRDSVSVAADEGAGKQQEKTLFDRSVSQASVKSDDSGYESDSDSIAESDTEIESTKGSGLIPIPLSKFCYEYVFMASIKGKMTSNSQLLRGILIPDEDKKSNAIRS